jgi:hypothetical protein
MQKPNYTVRRPISSDPLLAREGAIVTSHRTLSGAARSLIRSQRGAQRQGGYCQDYMWDESANWEIAGVDHSEPQAGGDLVRVPARFFQDHMERDLDTPKVVRETSRFVWIRRDDPATPELLNDAEYYSDPSGPRIGDYREGIGLFNSAKATVKALKPADPEGVSEQQPHYDTRTETRRRKGETS